MRKPLFPSPELAKELEAPENALSVSVTDRAYWLQKELDTDPNLARWVDALGVVDKIGDQIPLIDLLRSDFELSNSAQFYLLNLLLRRQLKRKEGKKYVVALLKPDFKLPQDRAYLADLLEVCELKKKKHRNPTPAYDQTAKESVLELATEAMRHRTARNDAHGNPRKPMEYEAALKEVSEAFGVPNDKLDNRSSGRRGSTNRKKRT